MNEILSEFIQTFLLAIVPPLAGMLAAWLLGHVRKVWQQVKDNAGDWGWMLDEAAKMAVRAAEQLQLAELIENKKDYAVATVDAYLKEKGFTVDLSIIEAAIEAAVLAEFNRGRVNRGRVN